MKINYIFAGGGLIILSSTVPMSVNLTIEFFWWRILPTLLPLLISLHLKFNFFVLDIMYLADISNVNNISNVNKMTGLYIILEEHSESADLRRGHHTF